MGQEKHTPGKFKAEKGVKDEPDRWVVVAESGGRDYIVATIENGCPGDTLETEGANAHLFAASLDMLRVLRWLDAQGGHGIPEHEEMRAAIAKAEGHTA